jgi:hypothetical protein
VLTTLERISLLTGLIARPSEIPPQVIFSLFQAELLSQWGRPCNMSSMKFPERGEIYPR